MQENAAAIVVDGLEKRFGRVIALDGVSLEIGQRGVTAILGANGAGKTTFINCALGLSRPSGGTMRIFGHRPGSLKVRKRTGVMLQDADLPEQLSAREHITLFSSYYPDPMRLDEVIETCKLGDFANKPYRTLSGGQKRRVQFALAIAGQPDLIFLDEPTTGLDAEARRGLWQIVTDLTDAGRAIILTTHYLDEADQLSDRIIVFRAGKVIADATPSEIRAATGGSVIRCRTALGIAALEALPAVVSVRSGGGLVEILSREATITMKALLQADPDISELTISQPTLEDAFLNMTGEGRG